MGRKIRRPARIWRPLKRSREDLREVCPTGKHRFDSEARASLAALKYEEKHGKAQRFYQCPKCRGWHLSTKYIEGR